MVTKPKAEIPMDGPVSLDKNKVSWNSYETKIHFLFLEYKI